MPDYQFVNYGIEQLNKTHTKPIFIAVGLVKPHLPWSVPKKYYEQFPLNKIELPPYREDDLNDIPPAGLRMANAMGDHAAILKEGTNGWKKAIQAYLAAINFCDTMIGRLLDAYDKSPQRDNTLICFWSDHGWHLGEKHHWRKFALWEEAARAPFIWVVPGLTPPNGRCERTVDFMSIYPTLTDLCGIPTPGHVQGKSLRPLLTDPLAAWNEPAITTYRYQNHTVRTEAWRYIHYADGGEELYDEQQDPYEWTNLAAKPESTSRKQDLSKWLPKDNKPPVAADPAAGGGKKKNKKAS
jgi:arylsulfatase A-like enzyme